MIQPEDQNSISRRDLLKLGAAVPFLALPSPASASFQPQTLPLPTGPTLEGKDHPEARGRTINKLGFIALCCTTSLPGTAAGSRLRRSGRTASRS